MVGREGFEPSMPFGPAGTKTRSAANYTTGQSKLSDYPTKDSSSEDYHGYDEGFDVIPEFRRLLHLVSSRVVGELLELRTGC